MADGNSHFDSALGIDKIFIKMTATQEIHNLQHNNNPDITPPETVSSTYNTISVEKFVLLNAESCCLCGHSCGAKRTDPSHTKKHSVCKATWNKNTDDEWQIKISSINLHYGEEPPISGTNGSGTIFFTHCSLKCIFCQNYPISDLGNGRLYTTEELSDNMLRLESEGAHNINLVSPTHYAPLIAGAIIRARSKGLTIPIVYNTGGYDSMETLKALEGLIDIYMPDIKYASEEMALKYSGARNYPEVNRNAVKEMYRQVGRLKFSDDGIAQKGLLIRHLVLPDGLQDTKRVLDFVANEISPHTFISIMSQYHPAHKALEDPVLRRKLSQQEYHKAVNYAEKLGFENAFIQEIQ